MEQSIETVHKNNSDTYITEKLGTDTEMTKVAPRDLHNRDEMFNVLVTTSDDVMRPASQLLLLPYGALTKASVMQYKLTETQ